MYRRVEIVPRDGFSTKLTLTDGFHHMRFSRDPDFAEDALAFHAEGFTPDQVFLFTPLGWRRYGKNAANAAIRQARESGAFRVQIYDVALHADEVDGYALEAVAVRERVDARKTLRYQTA